MIPKPRPDCEGWWWVKQVAKSGDVSWKCLEVELYPWHPEIDSPDRVLKVKAGFWFCADAVNTGKGLMDGSQWFPAAPPEWPGGGAAAITDRSSAMAKLESRGVDVSAFAARVTDIVQKGFNTAIADIKTARKGGNPASRYPNTQGDQRMTCTYCGNPILAGHPSVPDEYGERGERMHIGCAVEQQEGDELNRELED